MKVYKRNDIDVLGIDFCCAAVEFSEELVFLLNKMRMFHDENI